MRLDRKAIGKRIRELIDHAGISQTKLAALCGCSRYTIDALIHGNREIKAHELAAMAGVFKCSMEYILCLDTDPVQAFIADYTAWLDTMTDGSSTVSAKFLFNLYLELHIV